MISAAKVHQDVLHGRKVVEGPKHLGNEELMLGSDEAPSEFFFGGTEGYQNFVPHHSLICCQDLQFALQTKIDVEKQA